MKIFPLGNILMSDSLHIYNLHTGLIETEKIPGEKILRWLYQNPVGRVFRPLFSHPLISKLYGFYKNTRMSSRQIPAFVKKYGIPLSEFVPTHPEKKACFASFNDFFIRRFQDGIRPFPENPGLFPAFCEARYRLFQNFEKTVSYPLKGIFVQKRDLLSDQKFSTQFGGGDLLIARLAPVDYHRFHFPDDGVILHAMPVHGKLYSVNPVALREKPDIFITNERHLTFMETRNFGKMAYIEVGATCVGKIRQTHSLKGPFQKGAEKGCFLFGGSTVILFLEKDKIRWNSTLLKNSQQGLETWIRLGTPIGTKN